MQEQLKPDMVNNPPHYTWLKEKCGIEVIDIVKLFVYFNYFIYGNIMFSCI